jgi:hypothetical protein
MCVRLAAQLIFSGKSLTIVDTVKQSDRSKVTKASNNLTSGNGELTVVTFIVFNYLILTKL